MENTSHIWRFFRAGGFDQVLIESGDDIKNLHQLDPKLWVALTCPIHGIEFDPKTLNFLDTDHDQRIRVPEILTACKWACSVLKNPDDLLKSSPALQLSAINDASDEGKILLAAARQILINLGKSDAKEITADDTANTQRIFAQTRFNGDGIIPLHSAEDPALAAVIQDIMKCEGVKIDRSGKDGIDHAASDKFFADCALVGQWLSHVNQRQKSDILPLGDQTDEAFALLKTLQPKIDDYFTRCQLAEFDPRAIAALNLADAQFAGMAKDKLSLASAQVADLPLAQIGPDRPLALDDTLNPAYAGAMQLFAKNIIEPLIGKRQALALDDWKNILTQFEPYRKWLATQPNTSVDKLSHDRILEILAGNHQPAINDLLAKDIALSAEANAITAVDQLVHYYRDLYRLLNNFVSFRDFYGRKNKATFQVGTLYLDQRSCDLCIRVQDIGKHVPMAVLSRTCLVYCDCTRKISGEKMIIVAAFTDGDSDNLMVGRNGLFFDRNGNDWDANIVKIIDNPISIRQAFWSPYKRVIRWIEEQVAKRLAAADASSVSAITSTADQVAATATTTPPPAKPPEPKKFDVGVVAAMGVAIAGLTTTLGIILQSFFGLGKYMPLGIVALLLIISGPSMAIAWLKLRQRNLGPLLDANGWAVNASARINIPFGASLTAMPKLPPGAQRNNNDPYADSHAAKWWTIVILVLAAFVFFGWYYGGLERVAPNIFPKSSWVKTHFPTTQPVVEPGK